MEFSGPLPHPEILAGYEQVHKGLAERIVAMAEKEQNFGHLITQQALKAESDGHRRGQWFALVGSVAAFICSGFLGYTGAYVAASIVGGSTVVGLVTAFVVGRRTRAEDPGETKSKGEGKAGPPAKRPKK